MTQKLKRNIKNDNEDDLFLTAFVMQVGNCVTFGLLWMFQEMASA